MTRHVLRAAIVLAVAWPSHARADTIHVYPGESIQAAIAAAGTGDEIVVHPGTYAERIDFLGKAIVLRSLSGPQLTTIDGEQGGTVVTFHQGEGPGTVLAGFDLADYAAFQSMFGGGATGLRSEP